MRKSMFLTAAFICVLAAPAHAGPVLQGVGLNGVTLQGPLLQGAKFNGIGLNGPVIQGAKFNGTQSSGSGLGGRVVAIEF
jgi:uncharacterized protein YjbI with pentapeptide repeats